MCKKVWTIAAINLKNIRTPYVVTGLLFAAIFAQCVVYTIVASVTEKAGNQLSINSGNYFWLLIVMAAIFIPSQNFRRIVNLGGKREHFFWGNLACYAVLAGAVATVNTALHYTFERFLLGTGYYVSYEAFVQDTALMDNHFISVNAIEVFGWAERGIFFGLVQQFAFLFLLAVVVHTLAAVQDKWYGWAADAAVAAVLAVFIPIAPLRAGLLGFFDLVIFNGNPFLQIAACLLLAVAVYALNRPVFARKAI